MPTQSDVVILSVPHMEGGYFAVAPILLSACLREAGISAVGYDFAAEFRKHFAGTEDDAQIRNWLCYGHLGMKLQNFKKIIQFADEYIKTVLVPVNPKYIGLSVFTNQSSNYTFIMAGRIRKLMPNVKIVVGGRGLDNIDKETNQPLYDVYHRANVADLVIQGDAEFSFVNAIKNDHCGLVISEMQTNDDLSRIPIPDWKDSVEIIKATGVKHATVTASKGCVRDCTFCDVAATWPKYVYRDGATVAEEIASIYATTGVREIYFTDNLINGSATNYRKMNQRLLELLPPNTISYSGYAIFRTMKAMPEQDFALAAKAGASAWSIGVESGSERVRHHMRKKFSNEDIHWSATHLYKNRIAQKWNMMVGYPSETEEDFQQTLDLLRDYAYMAKDNLLSVSLTNPFMALDNSPIFEHHSMSVNKGDPWSQNFWTTPDNPENTFETRVDRWRRFRALVNELGIPWCRPAHHQSFEVELENLEKFYHEEYKHAKSTPPY